MSKSLLTTQIRLRNDLEAVYRIYADLMAIFGSALDETGYTKWDTEIAPCVEKMEDAMQHLYDQLK